MPAYPQGTVGIGTVEADIRRLEENPQIGAHQESPGPAINNLPAVRGSRPAEHFEGGKKG
jgi:hypothetical protein